MGVLIPEDFALVSWHTLTDGDPEEMVWTMGFNCVSASDQDAIATVARGAWVDNIQTLTSSVVDLVRVVAKFGPNDTGRTIENTSSASGSNGGALLPPNSCVLVRKLTALGGRKGRGRAYIPGISSISGSLDSAGNFSQANADSISAAVQQLVDDLAGHVNGPYIGVVLHSTASPGPSVITNVSCQPKLATQRRRLRP
jgi:hypothetical protein